jgi:hypothetical protein
MLTVDTVSQLHPGIKPKTLRKWIFNAKDRKASVQGKLVVVKGNGFDTAIVRVGRKVFIDNARLIAWMREQNKNRED